jgi:hypothetical protein
MIRALFLALMLSAVAAAAPKSLPKETDPCMSKCEDEYQKKTGACHSRSCFDSQTESLKSCALACVKQKTQKQRGPQDCTNDKGKKVPCSDLPRKPQPAR